MSVTAASFDDVTIFGGREFALGGIRALARGVLGGAALGLGAVAAIGAAITTATVAGVWMVGIALSSNPELQVPTSAGPARLTLADATAFPKSSFEAKWALTAAVMPVSARLAAHAVGPNVADARNAGSLPVAVPQLDLKVEHEVASAPVSTRVARLTPPAASVPPQRHVVSEAPRPAVARAAPVPLPRPKPRTTEIAQAPVEKPAPRVAAVTSVPAVETRAVPQRALPKEPVLPGSANRTALYDITGKIVYLPNGDRLEAHSGFGYRRDDPRYVKVKNLGPTPPNVYRLKLRERLFHGVRAIRMTPVDESKMFGRDGMLAHTYLLGATGQSNGCVSFRDYDRFLQAFLKGEVERIVVVRNLDETPRHLASLVRTRDEGRVVANEVTGSLW